MRSPPRAVWISLAQLLCAVLSGIAAALWFADAGESQETPAPARAKPSAHRWEDSQRWLTQSEIAEQVSAASLIDLARIFSAADAADWHRSAHGPEVLHAALRRLLATGDPEEVAALAFGAARRWKLTTAARRNLLRNITAILAENPALSETILARLTTDLSQDDQSAVLEGLLQTRPGESPAAAVESARAFLLASKFPEWADPKVVAQSAALAAWMDRNPELALRFAATSDRDAVKTVLVPALRRALALDPGRAGNLLQLAMQSGVYPEACALTALGAGFSPAQLRAALEGMPPQKWSRYVALFADGLRQTSRGELSELARSFPAAELFSLWDHGDQEIPRGSIAVASALADSDPAAARAWLAGLSPEKRLRVLRQTWPFAGLGNARFAELCVQEPRFFDEGSGEYSRLFEALADGGLEFGLRAIPQLPEGFRETAERTIRLRHLTDSYQGNIGAAMDALEFAPEGMKPWLRSKTFEWFIEEDAAQAGEWLQRHPGFEGAFDQEKITSPFASTRERESRLLEQLPAGPASEYLRRQAIKLVNHYAQSNPARGIAWLSSASPAQLKPEFSREFADNWSSLDPRAAAAWVQTLPPGRLRDSAAAGIAHSLHYYPEAALEWSNSIVDPALRFTTVFGIVDAAGDATRAASLAEQAKLTPAQREELQAHIEGKPGSR